MKKRSLTIKGHQTSISLEDEFWDELGVIAAQRKISVAALVAEIDVSRSGGLSSAIRLFILAALKRDAVACRTVD
jgi:predicted DNA-binding ribbon-helix-helix protein